MGVRTVRITTARSSVGMGAALSALLLASVGSAGAAPLQEAAALVSEADGVVSDVRLRRENGAVASSDRLKQAWGLYARAWALVPASPLPPRGICRLALFIGELGRGSATQHAAATTACQNALILGGTTEDMRNRVAAWVTGPMPPSLDDLVLAFAMSNGAVHRAPGEPWGYLARTDLALRLGDRDLFDATLAELRRVAPRHEVTRRLSAEGPARPSWALVLGRAALLLLFLMTGVHASLRWAKGRRGTAVASLALLVIGTLSLSSTSAWATAPNAPPPTRALVAPEPDEQLKDPLAFAQILMELTSRAEAASARGDHATAAAVYGEVAKAVPDVSYPFARMCDELEAAGNLAAAIDACRTALTRPGFKEGDFSDFVRLVLLQPTGLTDTDRRQLNLVIEQLARDPRAALAAARLRCNVAVHQRDLEALSVCTAKLAAVEPDDPRTISFQWALAYERRGALATELWLRRARAAGVEAESLERMTRATRELTRQRAVRVAAWAGAAVVVFGLAIVARRLLRAGVSRRRRRTGSDDTSVQRDPVRT